MHMPADLCVHKIDSTPAAGKLESNWVGCVGAGSFFE